MGFLRTWTNSIDFIIFNFSMNFLEWMLFIITTYEALFDVILISIAKVRRLFSILMSNWHQKLFTKKVKIIFLELYKLIPTQKKLNHSILNNEVKVMKSFILQAMKVGKTYKVVFCSQF